MELFVAVLPVHGRRQVAHLTRRGVGLQCVVPGQRGTGTPMRISRSDPGRHPRPERCGEVGGHDSPGHRPPGKRARRVSRALTGGTRFPILGLARRRPPPSRLTTRTGGDMPKAYWVSVYRAVTSPEKLAAYAALAGPALARLRRTLSGARRAGEGLRERPEAAHRADRVRQRRAGDRRARQPGLPGCAGRAGRRRRSGDPDRRGRVSGRRIAGAAPDRGAPRVDRGGAGAGGADVRSPLSARRVASRLLARAWAAPNTLLGVLVGLAMLCLGGRVRCVAGVVEFRGGLVGRLVAGLPGPVRFGAMTLGHVIVGIDAASAARAPCARARPRAPVRKMGTVLPARLCVVERVGGCTGSIRIRRQSFRATSHCGRDDATNAS